MKWSFLLILLIPSVFVYYTGSAPERGLASIDETRIEIGKWKIDDRTEMVLLGVQGTRFSGTNYDLNLIDFPLVMKSADTMIPKYLLTFLDGEVKDVFSFELEESRPRTYEAIESGDAKRFYLKIDPESAYFPKKLINIEDARKDSIIKTLYKLANSSVYFTSYAPLGIVLNRIFQISEEKKSFQAAYLERLIRLELFDQRLPTLRSEIGEGNLWEIAAALNLRFHNDSEFAAFLTHKSETIDFYQKYRRLQEKKYHENMSKLVQRSNEEGLLTIPISTDFAVVYAFNNEKYYKEFNAFLLDIKSPNLVVKALERFSLDKSQLIPLGIFSTRESVTPLTVVDFNQVGENTLQRDLTKVVQDAKEFGFSFLTFSGVSVTLRAAEWALDFISVKSGSTLLKYRIHSVAEFNMLVDSGAFSFSNEQVLREALDVQLQHIGVEQAERKNILTTLQTKDEKTQEEVTTEVIKKFQDVENENRLFNSVKPIEIHAFRYKNWLAFLNALKNEKELNIYLKKLKHKTSKRSPANKTEKFKAPVVMLLVDGLRPDRLKEAAKAGIVPNLNKYFIKEGHEFNSFVTRSLTLPSWGTIFSGYTPDQHGVRSNTPVRRDRVEAADNYTDIRKDFLSVWFTGKNRALNHFKESKLKWIGDYYSESETIMNYMPYSQGLNLPIRKLVMKAGYKLDELIYGSFSGVSELDAASIQFATEEIRDNPGKYRLVMNWFAGVDVNSHTNNESLESTYKKIDKEVGQFMETLKKDPVLKNAHIFLISDHGMRGGHESKESKFKLTEPGEHLKNTGFNLTTFLTGDYFSHSHYQFVVKTFKSPAPNHDIFFLSEFQIHPFQYTYRGEKKTLGPVTAMIDTSGDALAQLYFAKPGIGWKERPSYYDLTHYQMGDKKINLIQDFLKARINSITVANPELRERLKESNAFYPVQYLTTTIRNKKSISQIKSQLKFKGELSRQPVIVHARDKKSLLLSTFKMGGVETFRYIPLKAFEQNVDGQMDMEFGGKEKDMFNYGAVEGFSYDSWYTDRQLLNIFVDHNYPNAIFHLIKLMTLDQNISDNYKREAERPDMVLLSTPGFNFNSSFATEGDHGGIERAQVKNALFMTKLGEKSKHSYKDSKTPVMGKDIIPTIFKINNKNEEEINWDPQWSSLFK